MFGYFVGRRGAGCSLRGGGVICGVQGMILWGAECEMLSLILELQTYQLGKGF